MGKSQDLDDKGQLLFWPEIALHDFFNEIRVDFPYWPGEFPVEFKESSDFLRVLFFRNPFNVSTGL